MPKSDLKMAHHVQEQYCVKVVRALNHLIEAMDWPLDNLPVLIEE
jgi:hypothetical protein